MKKSNVERKHVFSDHLADISPDFMSLFGNKLVIFGSHTQSGFSQIIFLMAISLFSFTFMVEYFMKHRLHSERQWVACGL